MAEPIQARWMCGYPVEVVGQGVIEPGGLAMIGHSEAQQSGNWEPVKRPSPVKADDPAPKTEKN